MKFLIFEMKSVCYNSYSYFAESLGKEIKNAGHEVEYFRISEEPLDNIERFAGSYYDAIIDFNSDLPRALMDDDSAFLDHINGPFFDIILDHPLYHHDSLKVKLKNFHVICLDEDHKNYILKYYPHIKSVHVTPMTGEIAFSHEKNDYENWLQRPYDLLFSGTYTAPTRLERAIKSIPTFMQPNVWEIIDMLNNDVKMTIEEAVTTIASNEFYDYINADLPLHTQSFYLADAYVRAMNRKKLVEAIDKSGLPFHVFGSLWDEIDLKNAIIHPEVPFNLTFTLFAKSKLSVNIMPNFKSGAHDRVFSSQLNGAVSFTDPTKLLLNEYKNGQDILFFELDKLNQVPDYLNEVFKDQDNLKKIAQAGEKVSLSHHTWANIYEVFIKAVSEN